MSNSKYNISNINKVGLLKKMWEASRPAIFFLHSGITPPDFDEDEAEKYIDDFGYVDYFRGRCIKTRLDYIY